MPPGEKGKQVDCQESAGLDRERICNHHLRQEGRVM